MIAGYTLEIWAVLVPVVLFAAISKAGFGSGGAFVSAAILALILPPGEALGLMLPLLMVVDIMSLKAYWRMWDQALSRTLILWSLVGIALGAAFYLMVSANAVRVLIGAVCLLFILSRGLHAAKRPLPHWAVRLGGIVAGFTSFVSHAGGPAVAVVLLSAGLGKTLYQASSVVVFWAINLAKLPVYAGLGMLPAKMLLVWLLLTPVALAGTWLGVRAHQLVPERPFFLLTYGLLFLTGLRLIQVGLGI